MGLRELQSLLTLAEVGSITQTAARLNLTAAAIHKQLKVLESELGVQLYERQGRQLRLTQAAEVILPHVRRMLAEYEATLQALEEWKGLKRGLIRIGSGPTMSSYLLPSLIEDFRRAQPDVELFIQTGNTRQLIKQLSMGALDLAFVVFTEPFETIDLRIKAVWSFEIIVVSALPARLDLPCRMAELEEFPFILYEEGSVFENLIDRYFRKTNLHPRVVMRFDNAEAIKAMVRTKLGVSMLPVWTVGEELKAKTLIHVQQRETPLTARIVMLTRDVSYLPPPVRSFVEMASRWQWKTLTLEKKPVR